MGKDKLKSRAKAAGVKSTFAYGDKILMTSFGKGNEAVLEKSIKNGNVEDLNEKKVYGVKVNDDILEVESHIVSGSEINMAAIGGKDGIGAKDELEKLYFGKSFPDENIRIQLIYNILDIDKILAVYANNILYALNNLRRKPLEEEELDYVGMIFTGADYKKIKSPPYDNYYLKNTRVMKKLTEYCEDIEDTAVYFGNALCQEKTEAKKLKNGKTIATTFVALRDKGEIYNLLRVISIIRQSTFHGETSSSKGKMLYNLTVQSDEIKNTLNRYYRSEIESKNKNFAEKNEKNIKILFDIFKAYTEDEQEKLTKEFFDFIILKDNLNVGFSIKKLREIMLSYDEAIKLKSSDYDSVRHKLYIMLDFMLYKYCVENEDVKEETVNSLRTKRKNEDKASVYEELAKRIWTEIRDDVIERLLPRMDGDYIKDIKAEEDLIKNKWLEGRLPATNANLFAEAVYIMTMFLDGKEINDLLSRLINKFENIAALIRVIESLGERCDFLDNYKTLNDSKHIAKELRLIKSVARMKRPSIRTKAGMYRDAVNLLGLPDEDMEKYVDEKFCGKDKNLRNFIINNLIESSRFQYIARYSNPEKARKIAENRNIVSFVLKRIPDSQIERYYTSVKGPNGNESVEEKAEYLTDMITGMSFKEVEGVHQKVYKNTTEAIEKERKKAVLSLYLTVIYIAVKSLVNINARYTMAISAFERDAALFGEKVYHGHDEKEKMKATGVWVEPNYLVLADMYTKRLEEEKAGLEQEKKSLPPEKKSRINRVGRQIYKRQHIIDCIGENKAEFDAGLYRTYRNKVVHLNAVANADIYINEMTEITSYYDVYHYVMQRILSEKRKNIKNDAILRFLDDVDVYKTYSKNLTKVLNLPFAYNQPRYKNLTICDLFNDMDDKHEKKEKKE